jgi:hypothetical protein
MFPFRPQRHRRIGPANLAIAGELEIDMLGYLMNMAADLNP